MTGAIGAIDHAPPFRSETKVRIPWSRPVEEMGMRSKVEKQAEKDAARLLALDDGETFAVDPFGIANRSGVDVREPELDLDIRGALFMRPDADPRINVNRRTTFLRRRFTCALELGHYIHMSTKTNEYERVDLNDESEERGGESDDRYAYEFASSLLMPKGLVEVFVDLEANDLEMSLRLFVPREAMQIRLRRLDLPVPFSEVA